MGLLDNVKRTLNIGGATVTIVTDREAYNQGDRVTGQVHIQGGNYALNGESIMLALQEFWPETRSDGKNTHLEIAYQTRDTTTLDYIFSILPGDETSYPFDLKLPPNGRISTADTGWQLHVTLDIPKAVDPKGSVTLQVEPAEAFMIIVNACISELGFREKSRSWEARTATTHFRLDPPETLTKEFDYIRLDLALNDDGSVMGYLVCDLQEKSLGDYFKAMLNRDKIQQPILRTHNDLFAPDGTPNYAATALFIGDRLQAVIHQRNTER